MSYFSDEENDFTVYEAPKNGGTTLRLWIYYAGTGDLVRSSESGYYAGTKETYKLLQEWGYVNGEFEPTNTSRKVCIKRDPVSRFISTFYDKVIKEGRLKVTIDNFLDDFDNILDSHQDKMNDGKTQYLKFHFAPQTYHFGSDYKYYEKVFDVKEVDTKLKNYLEERWNIGLPKLHARNNGLNKFDLTTGQIKKIKTLYNQDYENGWCND